MMRIVEGFWESKACEVWWESIVCECDHVPVEYRGSIAIGNKCRDNVVVNNNGRESAAT